MKRRVSPNRAAGLVGNGMPRTVLPQPVYAEDNSFLIRGPRRLTVPIPRSHRRFTHILH